MLARLDNGGLKFPIEPVVGLHQQVARFHSIVEAEVSDHHMKALTPLRTVVYRKFQFNNLMILLQSYKKLLRLHSFSQKKD